MTILDNATSYVTTPSHDGTGQACHPCVIDFLTQHGINQWNGYRYWMVFTPYSNSNDATEDPNIIASNDGITWVVPVGITNPIDNELGTSVSGKFNNDTDMVYDPDRDCLVVYWREVYRTNSGNDWQWDKIFNKKIYANLTISAETLCINNNLIGKTINDLPFGDASPAIWRKSANEWYMFTSDAEKINVWDSTDGDNWTNKRVCATPWLTWKTGYKLWHVSVKPNYWENRLEFILHIYPSTEHPPLNYRYLAYGESPMSNITQITMPLNDLLLAPSVSGFDNNYIYRTTHVIERLANSYKHRLWYSAMNTSSVWHIGYAEGNIGTTFTNQMSNIKTFVISNSINHFKIGKSKLGHKQTILEKYSISQPTLGTLGTGEVKTLTFTITNEGNVPLIFVLGESTGVDLYSIDNVNFYAETKVTVNAGETKTIYWKVTAPTNQLNSQSKQIKVKPNNVRERG